MIQVPDSAVESRGNTVVVRVSNVPVTDQFTFYDPLPPSGNVNSVTSFEMSYTKSGTPRRIQPISSDPTSPFNWAGEMWTATGAFTFTAAYTDRSFVVHGDGNSSGSFGEMGAESNGFLAHV